MTGTASDKRRTQWWHRAALIGLGFVIFAALVYVGGADSLHKIAQPDPLWLLGGMLTMGLMWLVFAARWGTLTNHLVGRHVTNLLYYYLYATSSLLLGLFIPKTAGLVAARAATLTQIEKVPLSTSLMSIVLDKLFDAFMMLIFMWPGLLLVLDLVSLPQAMMISLVEFALFSLLITLRYTMWLKLVQRFSLFARSLLQQIPLLRRVGRWKMLERLDDLENWHVLDRRTILRAYWLTAVGQCLMVLRAWMFAHAVGLEISLIATFIGVALAQVGLIFAITPGGLGTSEAAWYIALSGADIAPETIVTFLVANRLFQTIAMVIAWLISYVLTIALRR